MYKKRLEDALNASKAINLGFNTESSSNLNNLEVLYQVNCFQTHSFDASSKRSPRNNVSQEATQVSCIQFQQDLNLVAVGDSNGRVQIYDVFSGKPCEQENSHITLETKLPAVCVKWHPNNSKILYFANSNGLIKCFDRRKLQTNVIINEKNEITCIDVNKSSILVSVGKDHNIRLYDLNCDTQMFKSYPSSNHVHETDHTINPEGHSAKLFTVKFDRSNENVFITAGWDRLVKVWDKRTSNGCVASIYGPLVCGDGIDLKKNMILTASWLKRESLKLWDIRNVSKEYKILPVQASINGEYLYSAKFCDWNSESNANILACGSGTSSIHLINYDSLKNVFSLLNDSPLFCLDTIYSGNLFACGSSKNLLVGLSKEDSSLSLASSFSSSS